MSNPLRFEFEFGKTPASPRDPEQPMRILLLGSFGGRDSATPGNGPAQRKIQRVDIDNFEDLLAKMRPTARVPLRDRTDAIVEIEIRELDNFHPDNVYRDLPVFHELRSLRERLLNPETFAKAAAELRESIPGEPATTDHESSTQSDAPAQPESDADTMQRILGKSAGLTGDTDKPRSRVDVSRLISEIVAPHIVPGPDPRQDEYVQSIDTAISAQMRAILHSDSFQSLEASWRGLQFLISNVETSEELQIFFWDVTKTELRQALESDSGRLEDSLLFQRLAVHSDEEPWSMLVSDLSFGRQTQDLILLSSLGAVAAQSGGPLLASAAPSLLGLKAWTDDFRSIEADNSTHADAENWETLRSSGVAPWIGLAAPRFLLRLPYGAATDPIDAFPFEEIEDPRSDHDSFLWGAPSLICATLIATSFLENRLGMTPGDHLEFGDLPAVTFDVDGEPQLKACGEVYVAQRVAESFLSGGVMPLLSFKDRNAIRLLRFQSVANPLRSLSGPWS